MKKKKSFELSEIIADFTIEEINNMFEEIKELREKRKEQDKRTIEETKKELEKLLRNMEQDKKMGGGGIVMGETR